MTETCLIPLSLGLFATVDAADYEWLNRWKWCARRSGIGSGYYAMRSEAREGGGQRTIYMHRVLLGLIPGDKRKGDHIRTLETLNNTRDNIRIATSRQNAQNRRKLAANKCGHPGVYLNKKMNMYRAYIHIDGVHTHLGYFSLDRLDEAIAVRRVAEIKHFGEFAYQEAA